MWFRIAAADPMRSSTGKRIFRSATAVAFVTVLFAVTLRIRAAYLYDVAVMLLLVLLIAGIVWERHRRKIEKLYLDRTSEAELVRRSEELKSAVLDAVAHEIRSPLNSIKIAVTALLAGPPSDVLNAHELLTIIDEEVDRMDRSIDQTVQLVRIEAGELFLHKEPQDLAQLIRTAIGEMGPLTPHRDVRVIVEEVLPPAECDQRLLLRVLKQLLNNAIKYSPDGSPLMVSAEAHGPEVIIDVVDRGPGVAADERERIFEKYYRGRATRARSAGGGLGLSSAKCIVEAHGGKIWVTSPPEGGAAFHVSLPAAQTVTPRGLHEFVD